MPPIQPILAHAYVRTAGNRRQRAAESLGEIIAEVRLAVLEFAYRTAIADVMEEAFLIAKRNIPVETGITRNSLRLVYREYTSQDGRLTRIVGRIEVQGRAREWFSGVENRHQPMAKARAHVNRTLIPLFNRELRKLARQNRTGRRR